MEGGKGPASKRDCLGGFSLSTFYCLLPTTYCLLPTSYFLLPTSYFLSDSLRVGHLQCLKDEHILQRDFFQTIKPTAIPAVTGTQVRLQ